MRNIIDVSNSDRIEISSFNEFDAKQISNKGWSFSYVYNLSEIKDVYLALKRHKFKNLIDFTIYCKSIKLPFVKTEWNKRRLLEHVNSLKNFGLIDNNSIPLGKYFPDSEIGAALTAEDLNTFKNIYYSYFRFKEISSWFFDIGLPNRKNVINEITENLLLESSKPLYVFSNKSRFTDSFITELVDKSTVFYIDQKRNEDLMRFWDVFIKWGTELAILEKFNLRGLEVKTSNNEGIACVYILSKGAANFDILDYIRANYTQGYIYLPDLTFKIATDFRIRIEDAHQIIIDQYLRYKEHLSFERTSEIFVKKSEIKKGEKILFPKYRDSFVSHLIVRE